MALSRYLPEGDRETHSNFQSRATLNSKALQCEARLKSLHGSAIAQAVSRQLPTAAARVRARVRSCGICGGRSGTGAGFLRILRFPFPILIPSTAPQPSTSIIWGWYNRPNSGRSTKWTQSHPMRKTKTKSHYTTLRLKHL
jgi:hypothetical protein